MGSFGSEITTDVQSAPGEDSFVPTLVKVKLTTSAGRLALCGHGFPSILGLSLLYQVLLALVLLSDCLAFARGRNGGLVRDAVEYAECECRITKDLARRSISILMAGPSKTNLSVGCEKAYIDA